MTKNDKRKIRKAIYNQEKDGHWEYLDGEDLHLEQDSLVIDLKHIGSMNDPVALFRPQTLSCFYGTAKIETREYKIMVIIGTDEGLRPVYAPIEIGTVDELAKKIRRVHYQQILPILPSEIKARSYILE